MVAFGLEEVTNNLMAEFGTGKLMNVIFGGNQLFCHKGCVVGVCRTVLVVWLQELLAFFSVSLLTGSYSLIY